MKIIDITTQADFDALPAKFDEYTEIYIKGGTPDAKIITRQIECARLEARGSAHVVARGSAYVVARGSAHVEAWDSAHVEAWGSAHVEAWGSAHVVAWDSAHVVAWDSAHVEAWDSVSVHNHSTFTLLELGSFAVVFLIAKAKSLKKTGKNCTVIEPKRQIGVRGWLQEEAVKQDDGHVVLFKRVSKDLKTQEGTNNETTWTIGETLTVPNWSPTSAECGPGKFHACGRPYFCDEFRDKAGDRYVAVKVAVKDLHAWKNPEYPHKIAFRCGTVLHECNQYGEKV